MEHPYKVGQKIKNIAKYGASNNGKFGIVRSVDHASVYITYDDGCEGECFLATAHECYKIVKQAKPTIMENIKEKLKIMLTPEPKKTFRTLGITNGDNELTDEGVEIFLQYLLDKNQDDFKVTVCDPLLALKKKEDKE